MTRFQNNGWRSLRDSRRVPALPVRATRPQALGF